MDLEKKTSQVFKKNKINKEKNNSVVKCFFHLKKLDTPNYLKTTDSMRRKSRLVDSSSRKPSWIPQMAPTKIENLKDNLNSRSEKSFMNVIHQDLSNVEPSQVIKENAQATYKKAVRALYERVDLLSSEELVFYYKFIINKAKLLYLDFLKKKGVDI